MAICHFKFQFHWFQIDFIEIIDYKNIFRSYWVPQKVSIAVFHRSDVDFYVFNNNNDQSHFGDERRYYPQGQSDLYLKNINKCGKRFV